MGEGALLAFILVGFPIVFGAMWLVITTLLMRLAGWRDIESRFPDQIGLEVIKRWGAVSGSMGKVVPGGVQFGNCLVVEVCATGMRVKVWKVLGLFVEPFYVPWISIRAHTDRFLFFRLVRLQFGDPEVGRLALTRGMARKIANASRGQLSLPD